MTAYQLAQRDLRIAEMNLERAKMKPNVPPSELIHLEMLVKLRSEIFETIKVAKVLSDLKREREES